MGLSDVFRQATEKAMADMRDQVAAAQARAAEHMVAMKAMADAIKIAVSG